MTREALPAELAPAVEVRERAFAFRRERCAAMLALPTTRACDALLKSAHSADNPAGTWHAKPQQLRRVSALKLQVTAGGGGADLRQLTCQVCFDDYPALKGLECGAADGA